MTNKTLQESEHYLARALGLLKLDKLGKDQLRTKEIVIKEIETYFKKSYDK